VTEGPAAQDHEPTGARARVKELLERHGLRADKSLGQNFLVDTAALRSIVSAAELIPGEAVLEVGPGLGVLTRALLDAGARVTSVELDGRLLPVLEEEFAAELGGASGRLTLVHGDALHFDLAALPERSKLVANLPYNVATPIVARALESGRFSRLVFLVQREVGERLGARPGTPEYGALSLLVAHFGRARIVRSVPPGAFVPPPKVTSAIVRIDTDPTAVPNPQLFALIRTGFAHRRKTLVKNLRLAGVDRELAEAAVVAVAGDPRVRAEALDLPAFVALAAALGPCATTAHERVSILP